MASHRYARSKDNLSESNTGTRKLTEGVIKCWTRETSNHDSPWALPVVLVKKWRCHKTVCKLSEGKEITHENSSLPPSPSDWRYLRNIGWVTVVFCAGSSIRMLANGGQTEDSKETAFSIPTGLYEFATVIRIAQRTHWLMQAVLVDLVPSTCVFLLEDTIVPGKDIH